MSITAVSETWPDKYVASTTGWRRINPEFAALWEPYLDEGYGYIHVAQIFGVDKGTVRKHFPGKGWTHEQLSAHGTFMKHNNEKLRKQGVIG